MREPADSQRLPLLDSLFPAIQRTQAQPFLVAQAFKQGGGRRSSQTLLAGREGFIEATVPEIPFRDLCKQLDAGS